MHFSLKQFSELNYQTALTEALQNLGYEIINETHGTTTAIHINNDIKKIIPDAPHNFPSCISYFPDPWFDVGFAPYSLIIFSNSCGLEVYSIQYKIKENGILEHQWNIFTSAYMQLLRSREPENSKELLYAAQDELSYFIELTIGTSLEIEKIEKLNELSMEDTMVRLLRDISEINSSFVRVDGTMSKPGEDNVLEEYLTQMKYFYYKYLSRWCALSKEYFESNNKKPLAEICAKVNWDRVQSKQPKPLEA